MRKIFLSLFLLLTLITAQNIDAKVYLPDKLDFKTETITPVYKAGDKVDITVYTALSNYPSDKTTIEYGVLRQIINGYTTEYEPISISKTEKAYTFSTDKKVSIDIPNILKDSNDTYVFYAKVIVENDIDKETLIVSDKNFKIEKDANKPTVYLKYANFLNSNDNSYPLNYGPFIYDLSKTKEKGVSSSTSLSLVFESNIDIVLNPIIKFKKLRSDIAIPDLKLEDFEIKKGLSVKKISLPNFNYESGVYQGVLSFNNDLIPDVEFQYIVAGNTVTVGQPQYVSVNKNEQYLHFPIYGTPIDFDLVSNNNSLNNTQNNQSIIYKVNFLITDKKNRELYKTSQDVDFSTTTYTLSLSQDLDKNKISNIYIEVLNKDGSVIYKGNKYLDLGNDGYLLKIILLTILLILIIVMFFVFKHKHLRVSLVILALIVLFTGIQTIKADVWTVTWRGVYQIKELGDITYPQESSYNHGFLFKFNKDISNTVFNTADNLKITYLAAFDFCVNVYENLKVGFSLKSIDDAKNIAQNITDLRYGYNYMYMFNVDKYLATYPSVASLLQSENIDISSVSTYDEIVTTLYTNLLLVKFKAANAGRSPSDSYNRKYPIASNIIYDTGWAKVDQKYKPLIDNFLPYYIMGYYNPDLYQFLTPSLCADNINCGGNGYTFGMGRWKRYLTITTKYRTVDLGKPSVGDNLYIYRMTPGHYSELHFKIPLNIVNNSQLSVSVDNITKTSARINWIYENAKPQSNYQVELSNSSDFANILQEKNGGPISSNILDKVLGIKEANAAEDVSLIRNATVDGLTPGNVYYARVRVKNSDGWGNYANTSFTTLADNQTNCNCVNRDLVCTTGTNTTTTTNSPSCALAAACTVSSDNSTTNFTVIPQNAVGPNIEYNRSGNIQTLNKNTSYTYTTTNNNSVQSISVILKDLFDNQTTTAACSINNTPNNTCSSPRELVNSSCLCPNNGIYDDINNTCTDSNITEPKITITKNPRITLNKGGTCSLNWNIQNIPEETTCSLTGTDGTNMSPINYTGQASFDNLQQNQKYVITCNSNNLTKPVTASATCRVNSEIREY